nr:deoxyribodipyrimidine photo-lyase [Endozoicomonas montiporae]
MAYDGTSTVPVDVARGYETKNKALYWFTRDLRLSDNPSLLKAAADSRQLLCVYCVDPAWFVAGRYGLIPIPPYK